MIFENYFVMPHDNTNEFRLTDAPICFMVARARNLNDGAFEFVFPGFTVG